MLHDIVERRASAELSIWWIGQSGFVCACDDRVVVFDPYLSDSLAVKYQGTDKPHERITQLVMTPMLLRYAGPTIVTASHQHTDHLDAETLRPLLCDFARTKLVAPIAWASLAAERSGLREEEIVRVDAGHVIDVEGVQLISVAAAHDQLATDGAGRHQYLGFVARFGGFVLYHSGDTVVYDGLVERLRPFNVDVAILPINGQLGNMSGRDAARLAHDIGAKLVIPCHYEMFEFNTADPRDEFIPECERLGQPYKVLRAGERFTLTARD
jgi:L-ascorbate metabolism protein UlaG (beta-lactamase superfamily)